MLHHHLLAARTRHTAQRGRERETERTEGREADNTKPSNTEMKVATMMVAFVAAVAALAAGGDAFVMPSGVPAGLAQRSAGQALAPTSQPAPSRSAGERTRDTERVRDREATG